MCDISIIIPTYNVSKYIRDAMDSINEQSFKGETEIIVIDDCSTDNTVEIIKEYQDKWGEHKVKLIQQPENLKQGAARNKGMEVANGKYIFFLDGDDFIKPDALEKLFNKAENDNCDFVVCDWIFHYEDKGTVYVNNDRFLFKDLLIDEECEMLFEAITYFTVNKLYKKEFLNGNKIKYGEGYIYEDFEFYVQVTQSADRVGIIQNPLYIVRVNDDSTTKTQRGSTIHVDSFLKAVKKSLSLFQPRKDISYYQLFKHLIWKTISYANHRAPKGEKRKTIKRVLSVLNSTKTDYNVPKNIVARNHFFFRRKYVQRGNVNKIIIVDWLDRKGLLKPSFKIVRKAKRKVLNSKWVKSFRAKRKKKKVREMRSKPIDQNTILFLGFDYKYTGNSRYFYEFLNSQDHNYNVYFATKDKRVPKEQRVNPRSMDFYKKLYAAKFVFSESWVPLDFVKRAETTWIQLWHGTPFKKLLFDSHEKYISSKNRNHKRNKHKDISRWDYLLSDSLTGKEKFKTAFSFDDNRILNFGYPRVQWLKENVHNEVIKNEIKEKLGIPNEKKVLLYVPTWRDYNFKKGSRDFSYLMDLEKVSQELGDDYVLIKKDHSMERNSSLGSKVITPNSQLDIQELILVSDVLVSDYSSVVFDGLTVSKPIYFFIKDLEAYEEARGVYKDIYHSLEGLTSDNEEELAQMIKDRQTLSKEEIKGLCNVEDDSNSRLLNKLNEISKAGS